jgi:dTDP-4-amino-4,6-dideoxygalactose transaminase
MVGAKIVFADISPVTFNISIEDVEKKITSRTKAVIPVDLYGQIYNYHGLKELADKHGFKIVEDACQAIGATLDNKRAGTFGDIGCFSFYATKNMITGEGGMLVTNDENYYELAKRFRHHGQSELTRYEYFDIGYNYRMMDLQAAIGIGQLKRIDELNSKRRNNASLLTAGLKNTVGILTPITLPAREHVFHQYTIIVSENFGKTRDELASILKLNAIGCGVYYPKPLHMHKHFLRLGYKEGDFPVAELMAKRVLSLPIHPLLTTNEIEQIIRVIKNA